MFGEQLTSGEWWMVERICKRINHQITRNTAVSTKICNLTKQPEFTIPNRYNWTGKNCNKTIETHKNEILSNGKHIEYSL